MYINRNYISLTKYCSPNENNPKYIIVHETDNTDYGAGAIRHCQAQRNNNLGEASVHYYVDDTGVYQALEHEHASWNCGDGYNKYGINNRNTISIEICVNPDSNYNTAVTNAIALVQYLHNGYYNYCKIVRHYDASRKNCPRRIQANGYWPTFLNRVNGSIVNPTPNPTPTPPPVTGGGLVPNDICTTKNVSNTLNLREIGSTSGKVLATINAGDTFVYNYVDSAYIGWVNVTYKGINGFVSVDYVQKCGSQYNGQVYNVSSFLNVRQEPNGTIIGKVYANEKVRILDTVNGWRKIQYDTDAGKLSKTGWVSADYVKYI